jgi:hypothetical protein
MLNEAAAVETGPVGERRRRPRLAGETAGWLLPEVVPVKVDGWSLPDEEFGWEVRVHDVSRLGVGFVTTEPLAPGDRRRVVIGRGPVTRAKPVRVIVCRPAGDGTFHVGAEFTDHSATHDRPVRQLAKAG